MKIFDNIGISQNQTIAKYLCEASKQSPILLFYGDLGAGKTTIIKELIAFLGNRDQVSSPTFSIINEYVDADNKPMYHMDLYRLNDLEEALHLGIEEYLDSGHLCMIEWPELILPLLGENVIQVKIEHSSSDHRKISIAHP